MLHPARPIREGLRLLAIAATVILGAVVAKPNAQSAPPPPVTNGDVIRMVSAKLGDPVILAAIEHAWQRDFDLSVDGLISLKNGGVPDAIIIAMLKTRAADALKSRAEARTPQPESVPSPSLRLPSPPASPEPARIKPQEPSAVTGVFRVNPATGELIPLAPANARIPVFGFQGVYLDGSSSPIEFKYREPHVFALRLFETFERLRNQAKKSLRYEIERLDVKNGKRYATGMYVPLDIESYGRPAYGLARGKPDVLSQSFLFTPRSPLEPGQYAFTRGGLLDGGTYGTFGIVDR